MGDKVQITCPTEPAHISSVYQAEMGDKVQITCPLDCTEGKEVYNWSKVSNLSSLNESSLVSSIEKVLKLEVQGVEDGGYYRCFSYCKRNTTAWIKLNGIEHLLNSQDCMLHIHVHVVITDHDSYTNSICILL